MARPAHHRPPTLPPDVPFDGGASDPRTIRSKRIQWAILAILLCPYFLYLYTENIIYAYVAAVGTGIFVLCALAWTALMCMILCRDDEREGDEEGAKGAKGVRGKEDGEKMEVGKGEGKVDGLQEGLEGLERGLARKGISL